MGVDLRQRENPAADTASCPRPDICPPRHAPMEITVAYIRFLVRVMALSYRVV